jgi:hypothetical protein
MMINILGLTGLIAAIVVVFIGDPVKDATAFLFTLGMIAYSFAVGRLFGESQSMKKER